MLPERLTREVFRVLPVGGLKEDPHMDSGVYVGTAALQPAYEYCGKTKRREGLWYDFFSKIKSTTKTQLFLSPVK